jgi:hypothetical protein
MSGKTGADYQQEAPVLLHNLHLLLHQDLVNAPQLDWSQIDVRFIRFLSKEVSKTPWFGHLALTVAVLATHARLDHQTVQGYMYTLNARWRAIFSHYHLTTFEEWNPLEHFPQYLEDRTLTDSFKTRQEFLRTYVAVVRHLLAYLRSLPQADRQRYHHWMLPQLPPDLSHKLSRWGEWVAEQKQRRKEETDALAPNFASVRGEAHLRWNQLQRLQAKFNEAVLLVESEQESLPLTFSYEEPHVGQRLHFRLWDRYSFLREHAELYSDSVHYECDLRQRGFAPEKNFHFLEFVHAEHLQGGQCDPLGLLWFGDLLHYDLLGSNAQLGTPEEIEHKQHYLKSWGYEPQAGKYRQPFSTGISGLLSLPRVRDRFLRDAQQRSTGLIFLVEPLFAAATFGLASLDFFTTTGARLNELLQMSLSPDCLYTLEVEGRQRFLMRLVPKGRDQPADYIVGTETRRNLERVGQLLQAHYRLQRGESIPHVVYNQQNHRAHRFPDARPYLFQFSHRHLTGTGVTACLRFLCHGLIFQTVDGRTLTLKAHMLRHAFATHIHQVQQVPLDVVAVILHQKNVKVTAYYAAPPWQQVLATANSVLDQFATHLGSVEEAFVRAPVELQRQLEEAKQTVGTLTKVIGGECTCHALCPISFACAGCVFKVPDPDREDELIEQEQWALIRLEQVRRRELGPEVVKLQALLQRCQTERNEIKLIREYRKDETHAPTLTIEHDNQQHDPATPLAPGTLSTEARAHRAPSQGSGRSASNRGPTSHH